MNPAPYDAKSEYDHLDRTADIARLVNADEPQIKVFRSALLEWHLDSDSTLKMKFFPKESVEVVGYALRDAFNGTTERVEWVAEQRAFFVWAKKMDPFLVHGLLTGLERLLGRP